jgi:adenylate kinase
LSRPPDNELDVPDFAVSLATKKPPPGLSPLWRRLAELHGSANRRYNLTPVRQGFATGPLADLLAVSENEEIKNLRTGGAACFCLAGSLGELVMRLILIGPPGSGKGTQAKLLSSRLSLEHISTGDILREAVRQNTALGKVALPYIRSGQLVPDDLVNEIVADYFRRENRPERFTMDGYPRTMAQAASFDQVLRQQFLDLTAVLLFNVDDQEIVARLTGRRSCPQCKATYHVVFNPPRVTGICDVCGTALIQRVDDREDTVRERLKVYHSNTAELIPYYRAQGLLREVLGVGNIEQIYATIVASLR